MREPEPYKLSLLALCLLSLALSSCVRGYDVELFNNIGESLTVVCYDAAGKATEKALPVDGKAHITGSKFTVRGAHHEWKYNLAGHQPPAQFIDGTHWNRLVYLQVERGGAIDILLPGATGARSTPPAQPAGFPITPEAKN